MASAQTSSYSVLSEFNGTGGAYPVRNLISDAVGNLYGVTNGGGQTNENRCFADTAEGGESNTCGTLFKLSKNAGGGWTRTVLHEFTGNSDGANPLGTLVLDSAGNLYGTARLGGVPPLESEPSEVPSGKECRMVSSHVPPLVGDSSKATPPCTASQPLAGRIHIPA